MKGYRLRPLAAAGLFLLVPVGLRPQNIIGRSENEAVAEPTPLEPGAERRAVFTIPDHGGRFRSGEAARVASKLARHVEDFLQGYPFRPSHVTLGISGYEYYFDHPAELFHALATAVPYLEEDTAARAVRFLAARLEELPPYSVQGWERSRGAAREPYPVPEDLRLRGRKRAGSAFGVFAFWEYTEYAGGKEVQAEHWPHLQERVRPLLEKPYPYDFRRADYRNDETQKLNGDLAGCIGYARLAHRLGAAAEEARALAKVRELLQIRADLERANPHLLEPTRFATKSLHNVKLARRLDVAPAGGEAIRAHAGPIPVARMRSFREARPGWYLAYPTRLSGGENYISPPHFGRAVFTAAVFLEARSSDELLSCVDVPWCRGDLYFIERAVLALWTASGRKWRELK